MLQLECLARRRAELRDSQQRSREPLRLRWTGSPVGLIEFSFPRWPNRGPKSVFTAKRRTAVDVFGVTSFNHRGPTGLDTRFLAAAVWLNRGYLTSPVDLVGTKATLVTVAQRFGLTSRQVHYSANILKKEVQALPPLR